MTETNKQTKSISPNAVHSECVGQVSSTQDVDVVVRILIER